MHPATVGAHEEYGPVLDECDLLAVRGPGRVRAVATVSQHPPVPPCNVRDGYVAFAAKSPDHVCRTCPDVHLICDNYGTHKTPEIKKWLIRHPRFELHFTPTSSSWLNVVERWFAELTNRKLRRSAHNSVNELEADIQAWIEAWNEDPKPFVWTKTADEILETSPDIFSELTTQDTSGRG